MARAWELAFAWLVVQLLDVITTATALTFGATEANPAMLGGPWRMVWLKAATGALVLAACFLLPVRHEPGAKAGLAAGIVLAGGVVAWNVGVLVVLGALA